MRRALAAVAVAAALAGCGGDDEAASAGELVWVEQPRVLRPPTLPDDRILSGRIRNDSLRLVELEASDLRLVDPSGTEVEASPIFLEGYVKPLESRNRPSQETDAERRRRGLEARIEPGATVPLTVSWRETGGARPSRINYGNGSLPLPGASAAVDNRR